MKVLLFVPMNRPSSTEFSLNDNGLGYVASSCEKVNAKVKLFSWNHNFNIDSFRNVLLKETPDLVGIKVFTTFFKEVYMMLQVIKETLNSAVTLLGGPHTSTSRPKDLFIEFKDLLNYAIAGDGEYGMIDLLKILTSNPRNLNSHDLQRVPGLIYKCEHQVIRNKQYFHKNLDELPEYNWALQQPQWFHHHLKDAKCSLNTNGGYSALLSDSRGCPANCGHCMAWKINGAEPRKHGLEKLKTEIAELVYKYNVHTLEFTGNAFLSSFDYLEELCNWLIENKIKLNWGCTGASYVDRLNNYNLLCLMQKAGCTAVHFGIESGSPEVLRREKKPSELGKYKEVVELTAKAGIRAIGGFMFGFPNETIKEINQTINYALSLPFHQTAFGICLPLPGTTSYQAVLEKYNLERIDWSAYNFSDPQLLPSFATPNQIKNKLLETKIILRSKIAKSLYHLFN